MSQISDLQLRIELLKQIAVLDARTIESKEKEISDLKNETVSNEDDMLFSDFDSVKIKNRLSYVYRLPRNLLFAEDVDKQTVTNFDDFIKNVGEKD